jgi:hypothetical protein
LVLTNKGQEYRGQHEPLVSEELFAEVQRMLDLRGTGGTRERTHNYATVMLPGELSA